MPEAVTAYPLCWPQGHGRRPPGERKYGKFSEMEYRDGRSYKTAAPISVAQAYSRLMDELSRLRGVSRTVLSTNLEVRRDGAPRSDGRKPADPAVALYFQLKGRPVVMPCDTYTEVAQNIAALAAHIEATRAIARHGVASIEAMFTGFMAIRAPGPRPWREVLGMASDARPTREVIEARRRHLAQKHHPDVGGSEALMAEINAAVDRALSENAPSPMSPSR